MAGWAVAASLVAAGLVGAAPGPARPTFDDGVEVRAAEGHATLAWRLPEGAPSAGPATVYELQQSRDRAFADPTVRHRGTENAYFVSGLRDGKTWFRVRAIPDGGSAGPWSEPLSVDVVYPAKGQVLLFLVIGSIVFLATVAAILAGWRTYQRGPGAGEAAR